MPHSKVDSGSEAELEVAPVRSTGKETATRGRWPVWMVLAAALFCTSCYSLLADPRCLFLRQDVDEGLQYGLLEVILQLRAGTVALRVDGANVLRFVELGGDHLTTCRRMAPNRNEALASPWLGPTPELSDALCGSGYAYLPPRHWPLDGEGTCDFAWYGVAQRSYAYLPNMRLTYSRPREPVREDPVRLEAVRLIWDLESELPEELDEAVTGTLSLLCEESTRLAKHVLRSDPDLATRLGCLKGEG